MPEIHRLTTGDTLRYRGPFDLDGLRGEIDGWIDRFDYDMDKVLDEEIVKQDHKQLKLVIEGNKTLSDYADIQLEIILQINDLEEITIETENNVINAQRGEVVVTLNSYVETDTEGKYEGRPLLYFLRYLAEKWFYKSYIDQYEELLGDHRKNLKREINRFLNKEIA
jgi:hypothetical protein